MKHFLFTLLAGLSLLLCVATAAWWVISYQQVIEGQISRETWPQSSVWTNRFCGLRAVEGYWLFSWGHNDFMLDHPEGIVSGWSKSDAHVFKLTHPGGLRWNGFSFPLRPVNQRRPSQIINSMPSPFLLGVPHEHGFGIKTLSSSSSSRTDVTTFLVMPIWLSGVILLLLPTAWGSLWFRRRKRMAMGRCARCGYDLRATPDRCPECGTAPEKKLVGK